MTITISCMLGVLFLSFDTGTAQAATFVSGSSCSPAFYNSTTCRGAFSPTVNTVITLPPSGVLDYTSFNVPAGVWVSFLKNAANTPVYIRTSSDVTINGYISVNATASATNSGTAGDGNFGDDGRPGLGGPGGYNGGMGGLSPLFGGSTAMSGGAGGGPGGGFPGAYSSNWPTYGMSGGGGSFGTVGVSSSYGGAAGATYGQSNLLPLVGGSGGGGGGAGSSFNGSGGGGGGGSIMIASSGTITLGSGGYIIADGSAGGANSGTNSGGGGGGGSGGAIRLVAERFVRVGSGYLYARGGSGSSSYAYGGGTGGAGIIRVEANTLQNWVESNSNPYNTFSTPGKVFVPNSPTLAITSITAAVSGTPTDFPAPANPTGSADITLAEGTTAVKVNVAASNIPIGTTVTIQVIPAIGSTKRIYLTGALAGTSDAATTALANVTLSSGNNVILATATYTVTEIVTASLPNFNGEHVAKIRVESEMGSSSKVVYITASGKEYASDGTQLKPLS